MYVYLHRLALGVSFLVVLEALAGLTVLVLDALGGHLGAVLCQ